MYRKWQKGEITMFVVLGVLTLIGVATFLNSSLNQVPKTLNTNAQTCNFDSGQTVSFGQTETNANNMENRFPISSNRHEYDFYSYFEPATIPEAQRDGMPVLTQSLYLNFQDAPPGATDSKVAGMMGKMFGYKPNQLADAYFMKYKDPAVQGKDTLVKGSAPALKVPITPGDPVVMPDTGYDLGGGKEAMVVFAAADRLTLHLSRAEYIVGSGGNNCNGAPCSGGYWIYIRGICVDKQIQDAYNAKKGAQEAAGANKTPIDLPIIDPGRILGKAASNAVEVIVRDNGPLISIHKPFYWQGVPAKDFGTPPTTVPTVPVGGSTPTPTPPSGATCGYQGLRCCNPSDPVPPGTSCYNSLSCLSNTCLPPVPPGAQCGYQGLRCCNPSDPVPAGTSCYNSLSCVGSICQAPNPPGSLCGYQGLRCCNPSDVGIPPGTSCFLGLTCNASTTTCGQAVTPTATPTSTVSGPGPSWTPTPTRSRGPTPIRSLCSQKAVKNKFNSVLIPSNYTDYDKFITDTEELLAKLRSTLDPAVYARFNFIVFTDIGRSYNIVQCDPANGKKQPCWDKNLVKISMRACNGDGYVVLQDTPKPQENLALAEQIFEYWGRTASVVRSLGGGEVLVLRYNIAAINDAYARAITGVLNNHTVEMWLAALNNYLN